MSRLKIVYILSLVILGVLIAFTVFQPMVTDGEYSEVQRAHLLQAEDKYIIQFDIINREGRNTTYTIKVYDEGTQVDTQPVLIGDGGMFRYNYGIDFNWIKSEKGKMITIAVYKESEATPIEEVTYYLK